MSIDSLTETAEEQVKRIARQYRKQLPDLRDFILQWIRDNRQADGLLRSQVSLELVYALIDRAGTKKYFDFDPFLNLATEAALQKLKGLGIEYTGGLETPSIRGLEAALAGEGVAFLEQQQAARDTATLQVARVRDNIAAQVQQVLLQMQVVPTPLTVAAAQVSAVSNLSQGQAETIVRTALSGQVQSIQNAAGARMEQAGIEVLYLYSGPDDNLDRPFCDVCVGYAFTKKQIAALNNNQGLAVTTHCGGYNCRHEWVPVPVTFVERQNIPLATGDLIGRANRAAK